MLTDKEKFEVVAATRVGTVGREKTAKQSNARFVGVVLYDFNTTYSCTAKNTLRTVSTPLTVMGDNPTYGKRPSYGDKPYVLEVSSDVRFLQSSSLHRYT